MEKTSWLTEVLRKTEGKK